MFFFPAATVNSFRFLSWLDRLIRLATGGIFLYAGSLKLISPDTFVIVIEAFGLIPEFFLMPMAVFISLLEVVAGVGLIFNIKWSLETITGLLVLFMAIIGYGLFLGLDIDCGCFGPEDPEAKAFSGLKTALYRDILIAAGVTYMYFWRIYKNRYLENIVFMEENHA